jgi:zinc transporter 1
LADEEEEDQDSCYQQDVVDGRQPKESAPGKEQKPAPGAASQMNMRGVFLHVMADALGSVVVIVSAIIIWQTEWEYKYYVDPGKHHLSWLKIVKKFT